MRSPGTLPERAYAVPASRHAVTVPPQSHWARAAPPGPLPRRHILARRRSGSPPASASRCAVRRSTPPSPRLPSDVRHARGVPPGIDCDRSRRLGARDRRPGPPHCPARACQKTPSYAALSCGHFNCRSGAFRTVRDAYLGVHSPLAPADALRLLLLLVVVLNWLCSAIFPSPRRQITCGIDSLRLFDDARQSWYRTRR